MIGGTGRIRVEAFTNQIAKSRHHAGAGSVAAEPQGHREPSPRRGLPYVDVTQALAQAGARASYLPFDGHPTPATNRVVADAVVELFARSAAGAGAR